VLTGTFNAEYGEALSGVVNQITKNASNEFKGGARFYTGDYVTSRRNLYENISEVSPRDIYNFQGNFSGPIPIFNNFIKFFLSGRFYSNDGYIYGRRMFNPSDSSNFSANDPKDWHVGNTGDNKYVPMNFRTRYTLQGKLNFDVGSGQGIVLSGMYQSKKYKDYDHRFKLNPDGDYTKYEQSFLSSLSYTMVLNKSAFIEFVGSAFITKFQQYVFQNPLDSRYVDPNRLRDVGGSSFLTGGTQNWHFNHTTSTYLGKVDLTWQVDNYNQIKTGLQLKAYQLESKDFQTIIDASTKFKPTLPRVGDFNYNVYNTHPTQFAAYIQDKIEISYLIVNIGLRFDYFRPDGKYMKDPNKISLLDNSQPPFPDSLMSTASAKYEFSPRLGISFPITSRGAIHISYGHFFQIPPFKNLYLNPNFRIPLTGNFPRNVGNTIGNTNLEPQKTVMYEVGLQQALTDDFGVNVSVYYKDIRNLLATKIFIKNNFKKFSQLVNSDYGSVKGITLSFTKRFKDHFGATLDYTYQIAEGSASDPNTAFDKAQASPPIEANKQLVPLNWDSRHTFNFTLTYGTAGDFIASVIGRLGSGLPYTPSLQNQRTGLENSENKPTFFNADFYLTKYFKIFGQEVSAFIKIFNLFDTANEVEVFGDTGRAGYTLELTRAQEAPRGVNTLAEYYKRPDFYSSPRQINIGATFSF
jgi:outer membrane receptor protein involved in Fe transport